MNTMLSKSTTFHNWCFNAVNQMKAARGGWWVGPAYIIIFMGITKVIREDNAIIQFGFSIRIKVLAVRVGWIALTSIWSVK